MATEIEKDCNTCRHHVQGESIDDAPKRCWSCLGIQSATKEILPLWEHIDGVAATPCVLGTPSKEDDMVNHPKHYTFGKFEVCDVLLDWFKHDPLLWQVGKYIARATRKGREKQDLEKAMWYLNKRMELLNASS
jgi:hypothetical protein